MAEETNDMFSFDFDSIKGDELLDISQANPSAIQDLSDDSDDEELENTTPDTVNDVDDTDITDEDDTEDGNPNIEEGESSPFLAFAATLHEKGFLSSYDKERFEKLTNELGDPLEALVEMTNEEVDSRADFIENGLNSDQKEYLALLAKGVPDSTIREKQAAKFDVMQITDDTLSEDIDLQKSIYTKFLKKTTRFSDEKISKLVSQKEDLDELLEESKEGLEELKVLAAEEIALESKQAEAIEAKRAEENKHFLENLKTKIEATDEILPGVKINKTLQDNMFKNMTTAATKDPKTGQLLNNIAAKRSENPIDFEIKLQYLFMLTNGFDDFSKITAPVKTGATKNLKDKLDRTTLFFGSNKSNGKAKDVADSADILKSFSKINK